MGTCKDSLAPKGRVEIFVTKGVPKQVLGEEIVNKNSQSVKLHKSCSLDFTDCEIIEQHDIQNIIVMGGKNRVIEALTTGFINQICRMAIGDRGTIPSDSTQPKTPVQTQNALFNEIFRSDVDSFVLDVDSDPEVHEVKFIKTFSAVTIPLTAYSNQANPVVNEVGLIMADLLSGAPLPRADVSAPNSPLADESLFSIRTFKTVPFEAANEISITIRYTIYIQ